MKLLLEALAEREKSAERSALATIVWTLGSTPREAGAKMLVRPDFSVTGTVGGGCGEGVILSVAQEVIETGFARLVEVDLAGDFDDELEVCGGRMKVLVEPVGGRAGD